MRLPIIGSALVFSKRAQKCDTDVTLAVISFANVLRRRPRKAHGCARTKSARVRPSVLCSFGKQIQSGEALPRNLTRHGEMATPPAAASVLFSVRGPVRATCGKTRDEHMFSEPSHTAEVGKRLPSSEAPGRLSAK